MAQEKRHNTFIDVIGRPEVAQKYVQSQVEGVGAFKKVYNVIYCKYAYESISMIHIRKRAY